MKMPPLLAVLSSDTLVHLPQNRESLTAHSKRFISIRGFLCVLQCLADAMKFELYHRVPDEEDEASSSDSTTEDENGTSLGGYQ